MTETNPQSDPEFPSEQVSQHVSLGFVGLVIASVGALLTCGILAPLGLGVSLFGLKERPRRYAIAGVILGCLGTLVLGVLIFATYATFFLDDDEEGSLQELVTYAPLRRAESRIEAFRETNGSLPSLDVGRGLIGDLQDRWGTSILYLPLSGGYVILSAGKDGELETSDDVMLVSAELADEQGGYRSVVPKLRRP